MASPNLYRRECLHEWFPVFERLITPMFEVRDGALHPSGRPGLGIEFVVDEVDRHRIDPDDPQAIPAWWQTRS